MSDIHYVKIKARNIETLSQGKCQGNNTGFPSGTGAPYYMEMLTFGA